jgi:hypothetical protein
MKKAFIKLISIIFGILCVNQFTYAAVPAYVALYGLNVDPNMFSVTLPQNKVNSIDGGFILLQAGSSCNISNISDGSGVSPLSSEHVGDIQKFINNGGNFGLIFGGAIGSSTSDPLVECNQEDLATLIENAVSLIGNVNRINFDIETGFLTVDSNYWSKISYAINAVSQSYPNMNFVISLPEYSSYWDSGYNDSTIAFFKNLPQNTILDIMMSQTGGGNKGYADNTISKLGIDPSKAMILIADSEDNYDPSETFPGYLGVSFFINGSDGSIDQTMLNNYVAANVPSKTGKNSK